MTATAAATSAAAAATDKSISAKSTSSNKNTSKSGVFYDGHELSASATRYDPLLATTTTAVAHSHCDGDAPPLARPLMPRPMLLNRDVASFLLRDVNVASNSSKVEGVEGAEEENSNNSNSKGRSDNNKGRSRSGSTSSVASDDSDGVSTTKARNTESCSTNSNGIGSNTKSTNTKKNKKNSIKMTMQLDQYAVHMKTQRLRDYLKRRTVERRAVRRAENERNSGRASSSSASGPSGHGRGHGGRGGKGCTGSPVLIGTTRPTGINTSAAAVAGRLRRSGAVVSPTHAINITKSSSSSCDGGGYSTPPTAGCTSSLWNSLSAAAAISAASYDDDEGDYGYDDGNYDDNYGYQGNPDRLPTTSSRPKKMESASLSACSQDVLDAAIALTRCLNTTSSP